MSFLQFFWQILFRRSWQFLVIFCIFSFVERCFQFQSASIALFFFKEINHSKMFIVLLTWRDRHKGSVTLGGTLDLLAKIALRCRYSCSPPFPNVQQCASILVCLDALATFFQSCDWCNRDISVILYLKLQCLIYFDTLNELIDWFLLTTDLQNAM